jgi:hypothetical protein
MMTDLYDKLSDMQLLKRAWHLARNDSRTAFMHDALRFADFAGRLDDQLTAISQALARGSYQPQPVQTIDVPKSSLSVRPGTVLEIEDAIVLQAIACLIAPKLDAKLPAGVYSWRVKPNAKGNDLFNDHEILEFPFLKGKTIRQELALIEPWYAAWPEFMEQLQYAYEEEGYSFLVMSDIVAYFENIDLGLLRDILLQHLPHQQRIINFLMALLRYWTWPSIEGAIVTRGIPQGNGMSSFLGNIYLLPLDEAFMSFGRKHQIRYLRYMDDVKILTKDRRTALKALFCMNDHLRRLRLNIQGAKTEIHAGEKIRQAFFDERMTDPNDVVDAIQKNRKMSGDRARELAGRLEKHVKMLSRRKAVLKDADLRLLRRLLTAFTLLRNSRMVNLTLNQLEVNPDSRLLNSAVRYLRVQSRNLKTIPGRIMALLQKPEELFPYQEAHFYMVMRYMRKIPKEAWGLARNRARCKMRDANHWYIRQQAVLLLGLKPLSKRELTAALRLYEQENVIEVKRAWVKALAQLEVDTLNKVITRLIFSIEPKLQRVGRFCYESLHKEGKGSGRVADLFRDFSEDNLVDRLFEAELVARSKHEKVRRMLLGHIRAQMKNVHRPLMRKRLQSIVRRLTPKEQEENH